MNTEIAMLDLETTGTNASEDRIIQIAIVKGNYSYNQFINPGIPIPEEATKIHGITDADVEFMPTFSMVTDEVLAHIKDCIIAGYNVRKYDLVMLVAELSRAGIEYDITQHKILDVLSLVRKLNPNNLQAIYKKYVGEEMNDAHDAEADCVATYQVLNAIIEKHSEITEMGTEELASFSSPEGAVDLSGNLIKNSEGVIIFTFGKHKNKSVLEVTKNDSQYINYILSQGFPVDTKSIIKKIRNNEI